MQIFPELPAGSFDHFLREVFFGRLLYRAASSPQSAGMFRSLETMFCILFSPAFFLKYLFQSLVA
jgi:hypothetical protein